LNGTETLVMSKIVFQTWFISGSVWFTRRPRRVTDVSL